MTMKGRKLSKFIDQLVLSLRRRGIQTSPEQIIDANEIGLRLLLDGEGEVDVNTLKFSLAPIFCADPSEQEAFYEHFLDIPELDDPVSEPGLDDSETPEVKSARPAIVNTWRWQRTLALILAFVVLLVSAAWLIYAITPDSYQDTQQPRIVITTNLDESPIVREESHASKPIESNQVPFQAIPRPPAPVVLMRPGQPRLIDAFFWLIITLPIIISGATLLKRIAGRRVFLSADRSRSHPELKPIPVAEARVGLYAFSKLVSSIAALRLPKRKETRRLDARKTVDRTINSGGFPNLVYETHSKRPGYVFLIERRNSTDFFAHAVKALCDYLYGAGLEVYAFAFKGRPYRLTPLWRKGHQVSYNEIVQRFQGDALVVAGDPASIRRGNVESANPWRPDVSAWSATGLLSSNACEAWNREEDWFSEKNFAVAAFGSDGFQRIANWLANRDDRNDEPPFDWMPSMGSLFPHLLVENPNRWAEEEEQPDLDRLLVQLKAYLGDSGLFLLAAIAAYPELRWSIARFMNQKLFEDDSDPDEAERRLLRIARLPWCREGRMPAYIREALLQDLSEEHRQSIQSAYYSLLNDTHQRSEKAPTIEIANPGSKTFLEFFSELFSTSPPGPYRDYIFQSVILDPPKTMLGAEMHRRRAQQIGKQGWRQAVPEILLHFRKTAVNTMVVAAAVFLFLKPVGTGMIENHNVLENSSITAKLYFREESAVASSGTNIQSTDFLAKRLKWALEARGFNVETELLDPAAVQTSAQTAQTNAVQPPQGLPPESAPDDPLYRAITPNFVFFNNLAAVEMVSQQIVGGRQSFFAVPATQMSVFANVISDQLSLATYNQPVRVLPGNENNISELEGLGLPIQPASIIDPEVISALLNQNTRGPGVISVLLVQDTRSFQDRLDKGGLGPVMTLIPPGQISWQANAPGKSSNPDQSGPVTMTFEQTFAIGKYEITFEEFDRFAQVTQRDFPQDSGWGRNSRPVINVSKPDAEAYAQWLSETTGETYRLPTDAEWEYAAQAGDDPVNISNDPQTEVSANNGGPWSVRRTVPVGGFEANRWGLHDMMGNVSEWVSDCWPPPPSTLGGQVDRGGNCFNGTIRNGSWEDGLDAIQIGANRSAGAATSSNTIGFRLVREIRPMQDRQPARSLALNQRTEHEISP
jgi:formylglycine-generating enzyme required for sulfatase activity